MTTEVVVVPGTSAAVKIAVVKVEAHHPVRENHQP
jgi:hypothetical protein